MQPRILCVDDAVDHQQMVRHVFESFFLVTQAYTLAEADRALLTGIFDLILLDVNLPDGDGISYFAKLRSKDETLAIPVMFVTSSDDTPKEIMGFSLGAEDYIVKPIEPSRLRARVEARLKLVARRKDSETILRKGDLRINLALRRAALIRDTIENPIDLTPVEFKLLFHFLRHEDQVFTRDELLSAAWGDLVEVFDRTVDMHISRLRKKIADSSFTIEAIRGTGYRFCKEQGK